MEEPDVVENFEPGELVWLTGTFGNSDLEGLTGTIVKSIGQRRWSVRVKGEDQTKVLRTKNLKKYSFTAPLAQYSLVSSADDWESAHGMEWDAKKGSYVFNISLNRDAVSFRILQDANWDLCVYPDRKHACVGDGHSLCGPDAEGAERDLEWTITPESSTEDKQVAALYEVRLHMSNAGTPTVVDWVNMAQCSHRRERKMPLCPTGNRELDLRTYRAEEADQFTAAEIARDKAKQIGQEGNFEVVYDRAAVRSGPSTGAPIVACVLKGHILRGTPHTVRNEPWLRLEQRRVLEISMSFKHEGDCPETGWVLMEGQHLGLGTLVLPMTQGRKQEPKVATPCAPGQTHCAECGAFARTAFEKHEHMGKSGHTGGFCKSSGKQLATGR